LYYDNYKTIAKAIGNPIPAKPVELQTQYHKKPQVENLRKSELAGATKTQIVKIFAAISN
jgi:hypothetical protein